MERRGSLRAVAAFLPSAHVFEGMREVVLEGVFNAHSFLFALVLSMAFLFLAYFFLLSTYRRVLKKGLLVRFVE